LRVEGVGFRRRRGCLVEQVLVLYCPRLVDGRGWIVDWRGCRGGEGGGLREEGRRREGEGRQLHSQWAVVTWLPVRDVADGACARVRASVAWCREEKSDTERGGNEARRRGRKPRRKEVSVAGGKAREGGGHDGKGGGG